MRWGAGGAAAATRDDAIRRNRAGCVRQSNVASPG